ncbi:MAG: hypothetical protein E6G68_07425, partial [Actinobacteria bacterium]
MKKFLIPIALALVAGACAKSVVPGAGSAPAPTRPGASASATAVATGTTTVRIYDLVSFGS